MQLPVMVSDLASRCRTPGWDGLGHAPPLPGLVSKAQADGVVVFLYRKFVRVSFLLEAHQKKALSHKNVERETKIDIYEPYFEPH